MTKARTRRSARALIQMLTIAVPAVGLIGLDHAVGQIIAIGPPSFQSNDFPSMETMILDRLAMGGQYNPQDLGTLAHLTVLESIAAVADVQADLQTSALAGRLENELRLLWDTAATFEESVSAVPLNARTLVRVQPLFSDMEDAYQDVAATLGASAGMSSRAAAHLRNITRLVAASSTTMYAIESDLIAAGTPLQTRRVINPDPLDKQLRLLSNDVVALIENIKASKRSGPGWNAVKENLQELHSLIQSLQKTLASQGSNNEVDASLHAVRRRVWQTEARIVKLGWPTDLERKWREARNRLNVISDGLGLPRVIDLATRVQSDQAAANGTPAKPATRIYRGPP
jgi:hypothetical protein